MLKDLMDKVDSMREQMENVRRETDTLREKRTKRNARDQKPCQK